MHTLREFLQSGLELGYLQIQTRVSSTELEDFLAVYWFFMM